MSDASRLHPDWRADQQRAVEAACGAERTWLWVAEVGGVVVGFVAVRLDYDAGAGRFVQLPVARYFKKL